MQRAKGGADENPTEEFIWHFLGLNTAGDKLFPVVDGNNQVHWREMAQLDVPWDQITQKKKKKQSRRKELKDSVFGNKLIIVV